MIKNDFNEVRAITKHWHSFLRALDTNEEFFECFVSSDLNNKEMLEESRRVRAAAGRLNELVKEAIATIAKR
jgi:hypothetical protein